MKKIEFPCPSPWICAPPGAIRFPRRPRPDSKTVLIEFRRVSNAAEKRMAKEFGGLGVDGVQIGSTHITTSYTTIQKRVRIAELPPTVREWLHQQMGESKAWKAKQSTSSS